MKQRERDILLIDKHGTQRTLAELPAQEWAEYAAGLVRNGRVPLIAQPMHAAP